MKLRPTKLSISATLKAHELGKEFSNTYLFVRQLRSQVKHPIILDYRSQLKLIADLLNISEWKLRKSLNACIRLGLASIEGKHLRLHSNQQDWQFKPTKKNDYRVTSDSIKFRTLVLFRNHYNKQFALIKKKQRQQHERVNNSASILSDSANTTITASLRAIAKMLYTSDLHTATRLIRELTKEGLISVEPRKVKINKTNCAKLLCLGRRNVKLIKGEYYEVHHEFKITYNLKRVEFSAFHKLPEQQQIAFLELGYTIQQIDQQLK